MPRIALVTADPVVVNGEDVDAELLIAAFAAVGVHAAYPRWDDAATDWEQFDLVIMRSPWDYPERLDEFLSWLDRVATVATVLNDPALIRWNLDKSYLSQLAALDVPIVPTVTCDTPEQVLVAVPELDTAQVVIKPNVSVSSRDTGLFEVGDGAIRNLAQTILASGKRVLVQPAVDEVRTSGETALVYFDGRFSHALGKAAILELGGGFLGGEYREVITPAQPTPAEIAVADAAITAISSIAESSGFGSDKLTPDAATPLYCRFDLVGDRSAPMLLEAEMFEPSYFLHTAPGAEQRFVAAVQRRLDRPRGRRE